MSEQEPVRIVLTPEQREQVRRLSGQVVEALELEPGDVKKHSGPLRFLWRLSAATGIPRQAWMGQEDTPAPAPESEPPGAAHR